MISPQQFRVSIGVFQASCPYSKGKGRYSKGPNFNGLSIKMGELGLNLLMLLLIGWLSTNSEVGDISLDTLDRIGASLKMMGYFGVIGSIMIFGLGLFWLVAMFFVHMMEFRSLISTQVIEIEEIIEIVRVNMYSIEFAGGIIAMCVGLLVWYYLGRNCGVQQKVSKKQGNDYDVLKDWKKMMLLLKRIMSA